MLILAKMVAGAVWLTLSGLFLVGLALILLSEMTLAGKLLTAPMVAFMTYMAGDIVVNHWRSQ